MQRLLIIVSIFTLVCLFAACIFRYRNGVDVLASPKIMNTPEIVHNKQNISRRSISKSKIPQRATTDAYYQIIIDNNIFRPLNYKPPQREQGYTLLGTTIATDGNTGTAYILERKPPGQLRKVKVGDALGESIVQKITPRRVTLTTQKGTTTNLSLSRNIFLNPRHTQSRRSHDRVPQVESGPENKTMPRAKVNTGTVTETESQRIYEEGIQELMKRANEIRSERARMQERLKYLQQR